jgi:glycosyltransferase involved in cell wall biosynthesis
MEYSKNTLQRKIKLVIGLEASGGGALKHVVYLAKYINKEIFEVTVVLSTLRLEDKNAVESLKCNGVNVLLVDMQRNISLFADACSLLKIILLFRKYKFDIVHAHSSKAGALFRLATLYSRIPVVFYTPHCFYFQGKKGLHKKVYLWIEKILARLTTGIILSENEQEQAILFEVIDSSKLFNINNAIDLNDYRQYIKVDLKNEFKIPSDSIVVGAVGRLEGQKGWDKFIEIAAEILVQNPNTYFIIAGNGELNNQLINKIPNKYSLNFNFIGFTNEISKVYHLSDAILSTSLYEGLPYSYIEAIKINGKLITTSYIKDLEQYRNKQYFRIEGDNIKHIAKEIIHILSLPIYSGNEYEKNKEKFSNILLFIEKHQTLYLKYYETSKQKHFNCMQH